MNGYSLTTDKTWLQTRSDIAEEMRRWGVSDWLCEKVGAQAARVSYVKDGRTIDLNMANQRRSQDNLRVLYLAIRSLRLNEVRGIADVVQNAYLQIGGGK